MRARIVSLIFCLLAACTIPFAYASNSSAAPVDTVNCTSVRVSPSKVEVKCTAAGITVLNQTFTLPPGPTVTLPPLPAETETIKVPVPGPTQTVTVTAPGSGATATVTATETVTETSKPDSPAPSSPTKSTGQVDNEPATLEPSPTPSDEPLISLPAPTTVKKAAITGLVLLGLMVLILLALFGGYILGYKEADVENATFMKRLLNKT